MKTLPTKENFTSFIFVISGLKHHRGNQDESLSVITTRIIIIKKEGQSISIALIELMNHMNA